MCERCGAFSLQLYLLEFVVLHVVAVVVGVVEVVATIGVSSYQRCFVVTV